jgi:hypothetical protein
LLNLHQIIINQFGLSIGEIETINNLFIDYHIHENTVEYNHEYASILEIEFIKDESSDFFDFIPIEKWTFLLEIVKNIKKRRGKKGLYFKITIAGTSTKRRDTETETRDNELCNEGKDNLPGQVTFVLGQKNDYDFIKGLERIEITIENLDEIYSLYQKKGKEAINRQQSKNEDIGPENGQKEKEHAEIDISSKSHGFIRFLFDEIKRKWVIADNE